MKTKKSAAEHADIEEEAFFDEQEGPQEEEAEEEEEEEEEPPSKMPRPSSRLAVTSASRSSPPGPSTGIYPE